MTVRYVRAASVAEAVGELEACPGEAFVLCGGTMAFPRITQRDVRPELVVDLAGISALREIRLGQDHLRLGAAVTYTDIIEELGETAPLLQHVSRGITGGPQIRNQGTFAGSVAFSNPSSEAPAVLTALRGRVEIAGAKGRRTMDASEFVTGNRQTALRAGEIVTGVLLPTSSLQSPWSYSKIKRSDSSWPLITATAVIARRGTDTDRVRLVLGAVAEVPLTVDVNLVPQADRDESDESAARASEAVRNVDSAIQWLDDELASASYRRRVAPVAGGRVVREAIGKMRDV